MGERVGIGWGGCGQGGIETTRDCSSDPATCRKLRQGHWSHTAQASLEPRGILPRQHTVWLCLRGLHHLSLGKRYSMSVLVVMTRIHFSSFSWSLETQSCLMRKLKVKQPLCQLCCLMGKTEEKFNVPTLPFLANYSVRTKVTLTCTLVFTSLCTTLQYSESVSRSAAGCSLCLYFQAHLRPVHMLSWCTAILGGWTLSHSGTVQSYDMEKEILDPVTPAGTWGDVDNIIFHTKRSVFFVYEIPPPKKCKWKYWRECATCDIQYQC